MKLAIFPLGNPGDKYKKTRHNAARIVINSMLESLSLEQIKEKLNQRDRDIEYIDIVVPDTFMNESGLFIYKYMKHKSFIKDKVTGIIPIVMYDDKDLLLGQVKLSFGNSAGGHNGVQSTINHIGKDFYRIRIGIGDESIMPIHGSGVVQDFVMSNFKDSELKVLKSQTLHDAVMQCLLKITN